MKKEINFERFCALHKKLLVNEVDTQELHDNYVDYKKSSRLYYTSPSEWIVLMYEDRTMDLHTNCLKRNKNKVDKPDYKVTSQSLTDYLNSTQ